MIGSTRLPQPTPGRLWVGLGVLVCIVLAVTLLRANASTAPGRAQPPGLRILATDDLADLDRLLAAFTRDTAIAVQVDYVTGAELVRRASAADFAGRYDGVLTGQDDTENLSTTVRSRLDSGRTLMTTPLVLGLRPAAAARLGPPGTALTWPRLAEAEPGQRKGERQAFTFGMLEPTADNSAAVLSIAAGLADTPEALTPQQLFRISPRLRALRHAQVLDATSYPGLTAEFLASPQVDGLLTRESEILRINATHPPALGEPLIVVPPSNGADFTQYRLRAVLPRWARDDSGESGGLAHLGDYLLTPSAQAWIATNTHRRPVVSRSAAGSPDFVPIRPVSVPRFPGLAGMLTGIYLGDFHYPTRVIFVLDISGSMRGRGITAMRRAFHALDTTIAAQHGRDAEILLVPFSATPHRTRTIHVTAADPGTGLASVAHAVDQLTPGGGTGIYRALRQVDRDVAARTSDGHDQVTAIFLITDGKNTSGEGLGDYRRRRAAAERAQCAGRPRRECTVPVYPVLVGAADPTQMRALAAATGGQVEDARKIDLARVLRTVTAGH